MASCFAWELCTSVALRDGATRPCQMLINEYGELAGLFSMWQREGKGADLGDSAVAAVVMGA
jgi:hypothetical protein